MNQSDLGRRLLEYVTQPNYRPVKPRVIAKKLKLDETQTSQLKRELKRLVKQGKLAYGSNHLVQPAFAARCQAMRAAQQCARQASARPSGSPRRATC